MDTKKLFNNNKKRESEIDTKIGKHWWLVCMTVLLVVAVHI